MSRRTSSPDISRSFRAQARVYTQPIFAGVELPAIHADAIKREPARLIKHVFSHAPIRKVNLLGTPFPKELRQLGRPPSVSATDDLFAEAQWLSAALMRFSHELRPFVRLKQQFDRAIIEGNFPAAAEALRDMRDTVGYSLWYLEARLLLEVEQSGFEAQRRLLRELYKESRRLTGLHLYFQSVRTEKALSPLEYDAEYDDFRGSLGDDSETVGLAAYFGFHLNFVRFSSSEHLPSVLHHSARHALADRYLVFVRLLQHLLAQRGSGVDPRLFQLARQVQEALGDDQLAVLAALGSAEGFVPTSLDGEVLPVLDDYTLGNYRAAYAASLALLEKHPTAFECYELAAKTAVHIGEPALTPFPDAALGTCILRHTTEVLARGPNTQVALAEVLRLAYRLDCTALGLQLYGFYLQHSNDQSPLRADRVALVSAACHTPRLATAFDDRTAGLQYLAHLSVEYGQNAATDLFLSSHVSIASGRYVPPSQPLPDTRLSKYRGFVYEALGNYEDAIAQYRDLEARVPAESLLAVDARAGLYRSYLRLGRVIESAKLVGTAAIESPHLVAAGTLTELLSLYPHHRATESLREIAWPILLTIARDRQRRPVTDEQLHDALDDFLMARNVQRPSELKSRAADIPLGQLAFLLEHVCTTDVLESSIWYRNQSELEGERALLCQWLGEMLPDRRDQFNAEIAELSRRAAIRDLTHSAERSRIYVDTDGIAGELPQATRDKMQRCLTFAKLREKGLRGGIKVWNFSLEDGKDNTITLVDTGLALFRTVFNDIKQQFVSSTQYGLDANLSQRIRHGTLAGEIRARFEPHHLVTQRAADGTYLPNDYWLERLNSWPYQKGPVTAALADLSAAVDQIIAEVKNEWIQIRGPANDGRGLFDFDYSDEEVEEVFEDVTRADSVEDMIDLVFRHLWARTERALSSVRQSFEDDLPNRFAGRLQDCSTRLSGLLPEDEVAQFRAAVTSCQTQVVVGLQEIADWFRVDPHQGLPDISLATLVEAVGSVATRCCGPSRLKLESDIPSDIMLPGVHFRSFWDLLYIPLDNAAKHSLLSDTTVTIKADVRDSELRMTVTNPVSESLDPTGVRRLIKSMRDRPLTLEDLIFSRREGRSGYIKLHKIAKFDLRCEEYAISPKLEDAIFELEVRLAMNGGTECES